MLRKMELASLDGYDLAQEIVKPVFDLLVCTGGFEKRSRYVAQQLHTNARRKVATSYRTRHEYSYKRNMQWLERRKFEIYEHSDEEFGAWIKKLLDESDPDGPTVSIAVDITCMSRNRMATVVLALANSPIKQDIEVSFFYAPAKFVAPGQEQSPITISEPVVPELAGWPLDPTLPAATIVGLGYEPDKAVGAVEYLEPGVVWGFVPTGEDRRYDQAVERANETFWELMPRENLIRYRVDQPFQCLSVIESLVYGLLAGSRPILVPCGPKLFALVCILTAVTHSPEVTVWRVSAGDQEPAGDRSANGKIVGLRGRFSLVD